MRGARIIELVKVMKVGIFQIFKTKRTAHKRNLESSILESFS